MDQKCERFVDDHKPLDIRIVRERNQDLSARRLVNCVAIIGRGSQLHFSKTLIRPHFILFVSLPAAQQFHVVSGHIVTGSSKVGFGVKQEDEDEIKTRRSAAKPVEGAPCLRGQRSHEASYERTNRTSA